MAQLFRIRWFYILLLTSVYLLSAPPHGGTTVFMIRAANHGSDFLDTKEEEVRRIAGAALDNHRKCELVSSCERECSRATCEPLSTDQTTCAKVDNNTACRASDGSTCKDMMLNYNKSYVTLPKGADANKLRPEVRRDFCLQRGLDSTFKSIGVVHKNKSQYSYMYYGSTSGAWRAFPGREALDTFCTTFECRQRPWYLDGISVLKQVRILIDTGNSMGNPATPEYGSVARTTFLQVAINISLSIIQTLSPGDFVDVISFNATGAYSLVPSPVPVGYYNQVDGDVVNPELKPLKINVRGLNPSTDPANPNLTAAIVEGISTFRNTTPPSLKIVVVITYGNFLPLNETTFPTADIAAHQAKLLMYKLPSNAVEDPFLEQTNLQSVLCGVQGSFEVLDAPSSVFNPLYAIRSYFSYLAKVHMRAANYTASWSTKYPSIAQSLDANTVTYPAIDSNGELIGVAAIDVFVNELEPALRDEVEKQFANISRSRKQGHLPAPSTLPPTTCSYQIGLTGHFCSNTVPAEGIICPKTDDRKLEERVCCNSCTTKISNGPAPSPSGASNLRLPSYAIALIAVGAFLVLAAVLIGVLLKNRERVEGRYRHPGSCCWGREKKKKRPEDNPPPDEKSSSKTPATR